MWMKNAIDIKGKDFPVILIRNKIDLEDIREVSIEDGENAAKEYGINFNEISNKIGTNVEETCLHLINLIIYHHSNKKKVKKI